MHVRICAVKTALRVQSRQHSVCSKDRTVKSIDGATLLGRVRVLGLVAVLVVPDVHHRPPQRAACVRVCVCVCACVRARACEWVCWTAWAHSTHLGRPGRPQRPAQTALVARSQTPAFLRVHVCEHACTQTHTLNDGGVGTGFAQYYQWIARGVRCKCFAGVIGCYRLQA